MTRTTISLHESVFESVRKVAHASHTTLGETITELLTLGLAAKKTLQHQQGQSHKFLLKTYSLGVPTIPLEDKDAINTVLDRGIH